MEAKDERTTGTILIYLCNGDVKALPKAKRIDVRDDTVVCFDERDCELVRFRTRDVYMCTSRPVPRALL
jgi:hypothetical protein